MSCKEIKTFFLLREKKTEIKIKIKIFYLEDIKIGYRILF